MSSLKEQLTVKHKLTSSHKYIKKKNFIKNLFVPDTSKLEFHAFVLVISTHFT